MHASVVRFLLVAVVEVYLFNLHQAHCLLRKNQAERPFGYIVSLCLLQIHSSPLNYEIIGIVPLPQDSERCTNIGLSNNFY